MAPAANPDGARTHGHEATARRAPRARRTPLSAAGYPRRRPYTSGPSPRSSLPTGRSG